MKKLVALFVAVMMLAALVLTGCSTKETKILKVYTNSGFAPFEYLNEKNEVVGVDIDIMNYIADKLGYKLEINDIDFDLILNEVANDKNAVGAAGMTQDPDRDDVALASITYATSVQYIIAPKGTFPEGVVTADAIKAYAETSGKGLGAQAGTTGAYLAEDILADCEGISEVDYANAIVASYDVPVSICGVIVDKLPAEAICADKDAIECWEIDAEPESYVLYFNKEAADLVKKVNEILAKITTDGTIDGYIVNHSK